MESNFLKPIPSFRFTLFYNEVVWKLGVWKSQTRFKKFGFSGFSGTLTKKSKKNQGFPGENKTIPGFPGFPGLVANQPDHNT